MVGRRHGILSGAFVAALILGTTAKAETVRYRATIDNTWSTTTHPGLFPVDAHFSWLGGGIHNSNVSFWNEGETATPGMKLMAETGVTTDLAAEVDAEIGPGNALASIDIHHWFCPDEITHRSCGDTTFTFEASDEFPLLTLATMLGPSPDWFVGVSGLSLKSNLDLWVPRQTIELYPYDGGTRSANVWRLGGPLSDPVEPIHLITEASGQLVGPASLGTLTISRILPGDWNDNQTYDAGDIDQLSQAIRSGTAAVEFDLTADGEVTAADREYWIGQLAQTTAGDADLNGVFDSADLVAVFVAGEYEDAVVGNSTWATGDWDGNGDFETSDMVVAFQGGGYVAASSSALTVPEPSQVGWIALMVALAAGVHRTARHATASRLMLRQSSI